MQMTADLVRVRGATAYPVRAASARVRIVNHIPFLREYGVELTHAPTLTDAEYALLISSASVARKVTALSRCALRAARARDADALFLIHRLLSLTPLPAIDPPRRLDIYDFDDALLVGSPGAPNRRFQWTKQEGRRAAACMRRAGLVTVANATLAADAREYASRVEVVPSCVDPATQPVHEHSEREAVTIGWIGSHTTVSYLKPILPVIARLNECGLLATLIVVGGDTGMRAGWIEHRPWSLETQADDLATFDIGVMPLPDTPWTRCKSGYKLLQYYAAGVPAVASPVGVNAKLLTLGAGIPAMSTSEWENAIRLLAHDPTARTERGLHARRFVERSYSYRRWSPELAALLRSLA